MSVLNKPMAWSFSVLDAYDTCPMQLKETRLTKRFSDRNKWGAAGTNDHSAIENRVIKGQRLPPHLAPHEAAIDRLTRIPGELRAELELCVTESWQPTGWFSKDAWARAKIDLSIFDRPSKTVCQFDWKSGKYRKDSRWLQLEINNLLFDAMTKSYDVEVKQFNNALVWLGHKCEIESLIVFQKDMPGIRERVMKKVEVYAEAYEKDRFPAKQNGLCKQFCPVTSCKFHGK